MARVAQLPIQKNILISPTSGRRSLFLFFNYYLCHCAKYPPSPVASGFLLAQGQGIFPVPLVQTLCRRQKKRQNELAWLGLACLVQVAMGFFRGLPRFFGIALASRAARAAKWFFIFSLR